MEGRKRFDFDSHFDPSNNLRREEKFFEEELAFNATTVSLDGSIPRANRFRSSMVMRGTSSGMTAVKSLNTPGKLKPVTKTQVSSTSSPSSSTSLPAAAAAVPISNVIASDANDVSSRSSPSASPVSVKSDGDGATSSWGMIRCSIAAGSAAGITATMMFHPLDLLRTKVQTNAMAAAGSRSCEGSSTSAATAAAAGSGRRSVANYNSPLSVLRSTLRFGGIPALYTGLSLPLAAQAVYKSCVFTTNTVCKAGILEWRTQERHKVGMFSDPRYMKLRLSDIFLCGATGGVINGFLFVTPVELIRNRLISQDLKLAREGKRKFHLDGKKVLRGPYDVLRHVLREDGIMGLWRGAGITVVRDSLGCGVYFLSFELGKKVYRYLFPSASDSTITLLAGSCAGVGFWGIAAPLDTIKTKVQIGTSRRTVKDVVMRIVKEKGFFNAIKTFYSGWQVAVGRGAPSAAVTLYTYEMWMKYLTTSPA